MASVRSPKIHRHSSRYARYSFLNHIESCSSWHWWVQTTRDVESVRKDFLRQERSFPAQQPRIVPPTKTYYGTGKQLVLLRSMECRPSFSVCRSMAALNVSRHLSEPLEPPALGPVHSYLSGRLTSRLISEWAHYEPYLYFLQSNTVLKTTFSSAPIICYLQKT
jgi:hypothetical protein